MKHIKKLVKENYLLLFVVVIAAFLRLFRLTDFPPSLNWDEVSHGYNAFSVLKTGSDEWGNSFPLLFRAYGDYKLPVYIYTVSLFQSILGISELSVRLPSALAGIATVLLSYLITEQLLGRKTALLTSVLVAFEPWSYFLSRGGFEANFSLVIFLSGLYVYLLSLKNPKLLSLSGFLFGLTMWTYNSYRVFTPIFVFLIVFFTKKSIKKYWKGEKEKVLSALYVFLIFTVPMLLQIFFFQGGERYGWVGIIDEGFINDINIARNQSSLHPLFTVLIHNKITYFIPRFLTNWVNHYSGNFLFFGGGNHYQFSIPGHGLLYRVDIIFLILGVFYLIKKRDLSTAVILSWFYLATIPSAITREAPHVLRSITILPAPMIIVSYGVVKTAEIAMSKFKKIKDVHIMSLFLLALIPSVWIYFSGYFGDYSREYSWSWQYGYKEVVGYIRDNYNDFDKFIVTKKYGEPHEFMLFYWPWDPKTYRQDEKLIRFYQTKWYWVDGFDKFYFVNDWDIPKESGSYFSLESGGMVDCAYERCLLVTSPGNAPQDWLPVNTIYYLNGDIAFEMYKNSNYYAIK